MKKIVVTVLMYVVAAAYVAAQEPLEVVPPVQGGSAEIAKPEQVKEVDGILSAATSQDAANAAVGKLTKAEGIGVQRHSVGSGTAYVAVGSGSYAIFPNPVASRISKRNATIRAYLSAQKQLADFLNGPNVDKEALVAEIEDTLNDANIPNSLNNTTTIFEEKVKIAIDMILGSFILYDVKFPAEKVVNVSIIVTPKTIKGISQRNAYETMLFDAKNVQEGVAAIEKEIKGMLENNIIFPTGGKQLSIKATGETAFLGYAATVINQSPTWPADLQYKQKLSAVESAIMESRASLVSMIQGNRIQYKREEIGITQDEFMQFEEDRNGNAVLFDQARRSFVAKNQTTVGYRSAINGQCPPGVMPETFYFDDNGDGVDDWAFSIAVWIPSVGAEARQLNRDIQNALRPRTNNNGTASNGVNRTDKLSPAGNLNSGQTTSDEDL